LAGNPIGDVPVAGRYVDQVRPPQAWLLEPDCGKLLGRDDDLRLCKAAPDPGG
jgi:hypothetical protein